MANADHNLKNIRDPQAIEERAEGPHKANPWTKASSYYRNTAPGNSE
jgi:hypothetical protein